MSLFFRIVVNLTNSLAFALGIWVVYRANQESITLSKSPKSVDRDALDHMYFVVAIFAVVSTVVNLLGSIIVNINSDGAKFIYCIILGAFAVIFVVLTVVTVEFVDEFEDTMTYLLYEAIVNYNRSRGNAFLDKLQQDLKCCGAEGVRHFRNCTSLLLNCSLPESCCPKGFANFTCTNATAYEDTCEHKVTYSFERHTQWIVISMLLMAGYFIVLIVLETVFRRNVQRLDVERTEQLTD